MQSVQSVVVAEERGDEEDLSDGVGQVQRLDDHVTRDHVVAVLASADEAADLRDEVLDPNGAAGPVVALDEQVAVHLVDDVPHGLLAHFEVMRLARRVRSVHNARQVDAGPLAEKMQNRSE